MIPMNYSTYKCNEQIDNFTFACSCMDCIDSCPVAPVYPPDEKPWKLFGFYGYMVIVAGVFVAFAAVFIAVMELAHVHQQRKNNQIVVSPNLALSDVVSRFNYRFSRSLLVLDTDIRVKIFKSFLRF